MIRVVRVEHGVTENVTDVWQLWFGVKLLICHQSYEMSHQRVENLFLIHRFLPIISSGNISYCILFHSVFENMYHRLQRIKVYQCPLWLSFIIPECSFKLLYMNRCEHRFECLSSLICHRDRIIYRVKFFPFMVWVVQPLQWSDQENYSHHQ